MIDLDSVRVAANRNRIPDSIWMILCVVTVFSMAAVGYQFGLSEARSWAVTILLVIVFITVIMLIADLHRPQAGLLKISQQPLQLQIERAKGWWEMIAEASQPMSCYLKTSDIAKMVGVHANTVRLYEAKGFLAPIPRSKSGYRLFTTLHLEQMRLAHLALKWPYPPGGQEVVLALVRRAANGDLGTAMELAYVHLANIRMELTLAQAAVEFLEQWAHGRGFEPAKRTFSIGQAANYLGATADQLRNWDRSGLLDVPRDPETGYRLYGGAEIGRLRVIRMLRQAGYSLMAILRMLRQYDAGETDRLRQALDTPGENEAIETVADRWLTTLAEQEKRAQAIIQQIAGMIAADLRPG